MIRVIKCSDECKWRIQLYYCWIVNTIHISILENPNLPEHNLCKTAEWYMHTTMPGPISTSIIGGIWSILFGDRQPLSGIHEYYMIIWWGFWSSFQRQLYSAGTCSPPKVTRGRGARRLAIFFYKIDQN